jgi:NarL family two-component system response regulator LiaR
VCIKDEPTIISVLIVEDHPMTRDGLRGYVSTAEDIMVIACTDDGKEAVALVQEHVPDVVLMDLELENSEIDGIQATRLITDVSPNTQVLAVTAHYEDNYVFPALTAGASGYVLKTASSDEILDAIRSVARRQPRLDRGIFEKIRQFINMQQGVTEPESAPHLTSREWDVLDLLAEGLSNAEIADQLVITVKTVKTHVSNILQKLHLSDRHQARFWVMQHRSKPNGTDDF